MRALFALLIGLLATSSDPIRGPVTYDDPQGRFSVFIPENWLGGPGEGPVASFLLTALRGSDLLGMCMVAVVATPTTQAMTQAELDAKAEADLDTLKAIQSRDGSTVEDIGSRQGDGHKVFHVVVVSGSQKTKTRMEFHLLPGVSHVVACSAEAALFADASPDFEKIFLSYVARKSLIAQAPRPAGPSVVTLYTGAKYDGTAVVVAQDTADVAALGPRARILSVSISGFEQWEACEGANFTGRCQVLGAMETADAGALRIGSLRRHKAPWSLAAFADAARAQLIQWEKTRR